MIMINYSNRKGKPSAEQQGKGDQDEETGNNPPHSRDRVMSPNVEFGSE
jgi:hypothetical protein